MTALRALAGLLFVAACAAAYAASIYFALVGEQPW